MLDASRPTSHPLDIRARFHEPHLERVSRSFAFGIRRLEPSLRASVGLGYLICRILDTIEDARWPLGSDQERAFHDFNLFLTAAVPDRQAIRAWAAKFPAGISDGERRLVDEAAEVFAEFASLSEHERAAMLNPILSMSRGMTWFTERTRRTGEMRLRDLSDVNVYCFFVAGVVGELLTGLVAEEMRPIGRELIEMRPIGRESIWELATHFGLFLQKMNVLKDQGADEREGRFLVPDRSAVLASLRTNAEGAFRYLSAIPLSRKDYRLFCAWALYLGLATVPLLREPGATLLAPKITRAQALALGAKIELAILDNVRLHALFTQLVQEGWPGPLAASAITNGVGSGEAKMSLEQNYVGAMDITQLAQLLEQA